MSLTGKPKRASTKTRALKYASAVTIAALACISMLGVGVVVSASHASDPMEQSLQRFSALGHLSFQQRPADVQSVMTTMYGNEGRFRTLSALFVVHAPLTPAGSVQLDIQSPDHFSLAEYPGQDDTAGSPTEIVVGDGTAITFYDVARNVYTRLGYPPFQELPALATVPVGMIARSVTKTGLNGSVVGRGLGAFADLYIHPGYLITSRFFTDKSISTASETTLDGRRVWELRGTQVQQDKSVSALGNSWAMFVDQQTGVVLRLEYYQDADLIGWAEMRDLTVDNSPQQVSAASKWLGTFSLPADAQEVSFQDYSASDR